MKLIKSGIGNFGIVSDSTQDAVEAKDYRYIVVTREGGHPGSLGGSSGYKIRGTNDLKELLGREIFGDRSVEVTDTQNGKHISKEALARQYLASLSAEQKAVLLDELLLKHVMLLAE